MMDTAINIKHLFAFVKENIYNDVYRHHKAIYCDKLMATAIIILTLLQSHLFQNEHTVSVISTR